MVLTSIVLTSSPLFVSAAPKTVQYAVKDIFND
jgi:hypothetical protein